MALRVIEVVIPRSDKDDVLDSLEEHRPDEGYVFWSSPLEDDLVSFRLILDVQETENILDKLEGLFAWTDKYRIVVYPAEATLPRMDQLAKEENGDAETEEEKEKRIERISRDELYADILDTTLLSKSFVVLVMLASLVAIIGLLRDNVAIIIGVMVLAPLLGPNVGLSLATTLGDKTLTLASLKTLVVGVALSFALASGAGLLLGLPEVGDELMGRSAITFSDIVLAIVSGAAGIITVTQGVPTSLVGVMVALALLPPLIASGLFCGAGMLPEAAGAGMLFLVNIICLNLAGVVTFVLQGIQPISWGEKKMAKAAVTRAAVMWTILLAALIAIMIAQKH